MNFFSKYKFFNVNNKKQTTKYLMIFDRIF